MRRSRHLGGVFSAAILLAALTRGAPVDLGHGLVYTDAESAAELAATQRAVIDLRFVPADIDVPAVVTSPVPSAKVVLLAGPSAASWIERLAARAPTLLLLAPADAGLASDLTVAVSAAEVREAVDAIAAGTDLVALTRPPVDKERFDESALVRHHNGDLPADSADSAEDVPDDAPDETPAKATTPTDPMLQRAVQVLLGLKALGRG